MVWLNARLPRAPPAPFGAGEKRAVAGRRQRARKMNLPPSCLREVIIKLDYQPDEAPDEPNGS